MQTRKITYQPGINAEQTTEPQAGGYSHLRSPFLLRSGTNAQNRTVQTLTCGFITFCVQKFHSVAGTRIENIQPEKSKKKVQNFQGSIVYTMFYRNCTSGRPTFQGKEKRARSFYRVFTLLIAIRMVTPFFFPCMPERERLDFSITKLEAAIYTPVHGIREEATVENNFV